jgi:hypothetical protein
MEMTVRWRHAGLTAVAACLTALAVRGADASSGNGFIRLPAAHAEQTGTPPEGSARADTLVLANEPAGRSAGLVLDFKLDAVPHVRTPLARLQLAEVRKLPVSRPGQTPGAGRGVLHVFARPSAGQALEFAGGTVVKPAGTPLAYTIDVTGAVNGVLARPAGQKTLRLDLRMLGTPSFYEVYGVPTGPGKVSPTLEIASPAGWSDDWEQRMAPITHGPVVYRESCLPLMANQGTELTLRLLFPVKKVVEVIHNATGAKLREGRDWVLRDGMVIVPPGSAAPIQSESEFFATPRKGKDGKVELVRSAIRLVEGTWYHERQIEVSYEPAARDWAFPPSVSSLDQLPRLKRLLTAKAPVRVVLFGDSIAAGCNASRFQGCRPYQPAFGELVAWRLERHCGSRVTLMNHSRGGGTSAYGATQAESQVAWFRPDLTIIAFGMNDRAPARRDGYRANLERIIDTVRATSPDTEFVVVTSMLNNPRQPDGSGPVLRLRDDALRIARPGLAVVDVTAAHQELLQRKSYLDLSGNGVNHPNDFLHRVYAQRVCEVLAPGAPR